MDETYQQVSVTMNASPEDIFSVLADPSRHKDFDGSGMVREPEASAPITKTGDVFTMNMYTESMGGDYKMDNYIVQFEPDRMIAWQPALHGQRPAGWFWSYIVDPTEDGTVVTLRYDWSQVTHPKVLAMDLFPAVTEDQMRESLGDLQRLVESR